MLPICSFSQLNLVPNPSFELYRTCPNNGGQIIKAIPWFQPHTGPSGSSTDYFNACAPNVFVSVPFNDFGFQLAKSGSAYSGFYTYGLSSYREYLEVQLIDTLLPGQEYCVSFYVSLPDKASIAADGIGAYLSDSAVFYSSSSWVPLSNIPQVENPSGNIIGDSINWIHIQNSFIAAGEEQFITIGNFRPDSLTDTLPANPFWWSQPVSYLYIDDVSVFQGSCSVGVVENYVGNATVQTYPNPTTGIVHLKNAENAITEISDASGRIVIAEKNKNIMNLGNFENGIYYLKLTLKDRKILFRKIILNKL